MWNAPLLVSAIGLLCCLLLGGATGSGHLSDALLQLVSIPVLLVALWRLPDIASFKQLGFPLLFLAALVLVPVAQLLPLSPRLWMALPGREPIIANFQLLDQEPPWMALSVAPQSTWLAVLSLLPPVAVFLTTALHSHRERRHLTLLVLAVGAVSVFVGLSQVAQGPNSPLRFFAVTNPTEAVGFFANRNHFAALLYALALFAAAWAVIAINQEARHQRRDTVWILAIAGSLVLLIVLIGAQAMARSRAGIGLTIVALLGAFALALRGSRDHAGARSSTRLIAGAVALAAILAMQYGLYRVMQRFTVDPLQDARFMLAEAAAAAAKAFMPFGSGMGTFVPVYAMLEKPQHALTNVFVNRAHNDFLELWLEAGVAMFVLLAVFLVWLGRTAVRVWRGSESSSTVDLTIARAATLIIALLIAHSFVDYPLRTGALMGMFAFACALLVPPPLAADDKDDAIDDESDEEDEQSERRSARAAARREPARAAQPGPSKPRERWGDDVKWPDEWR